MCVFVAILTIVVAHLETQSSVDFARTSKLQKENGEKDQNLLKHISNINIEKTTRTENINYPE